MERITGNIDISRIKRFQVPDAIVKMECPKCGDVCNIELIDQIYYPSDPIDPERGHVIAFECETCDLVITRKVNIVSAVATFDIGDPEIA